MNKKIFACVMPFIFGITNASEMPCVGQEQHLLKYMSYLNNQNQRDFSSCIRNYRVCILTEEGKVLNAQSIREIKNSSEIDSVTLGIVQTPATEEVAACLSGMYGSCQQRCRVKSCCLQ